MVVRRNRGRTLPVRPYHSCLALLVPLCLTLQKLRRFVGLGVRFQAVIAECGRDYLFGSPRRRKFARALADE